MTPLSDKINKINKVNKLPPMLLRLSPASRGIVLAALAVAWLAGVWWPTRQDNALQQQRISAARGDLERMRAMAAEAARLRAAATPRATPPTAAELPALLERSLAAHTLDAQLKQLEPDGRGGVRLQFAPLPFPQLAGWLHHLEQRGVVVKEATLEASPPGNRVRAQLTVAPEGP